MNLENIKDDIGTTIELPFVLTRYAAASIFNGYGILSIMIFYVVFQINELVHDRFTGNVWFLLIFFIFGSIVVGLLWYLSAMVTRIRINDEELTLTLKFGFFFCVNRVFNRNEKFKITGAIFERPEIVKLLMTKSDQPDRYLLKIQKNTIKVFPMACDLNTGGHIVEVLNKWKKEK